MNRLINYFSLIVILILAGMPGFSMTEKELRSILTSSYGGGGSARAIGKNFALHYNIPVLLGEKLLMGFRTNAPYLSSTIREVLDILNQRPEYAHSEPSVATSFSAATAAHNPHSHRQEKTPEETEEEQLAGSLKESRLEAERHQTRRDAAQRAEDAARTAAVEASRREAEAERAQKKAAQQVQENRGTTTQWLKDTLLIGEDRDAIAGFPAAKHRLDVFNPLYGNNFVGAPPAQRKAFPNVPIIHQYDPNAASNGGFFPLVVKLPPLSQLYLPDHIKGQLNLAAYPNCEIYWTVQSNGSIAAVGRGAADNIVFRPQYWAQPNGAPIKFSATAHLIDPDGKHYPLGAVGYSIHDGVASPNVPIIPFQKKLRSDTSVSFWSLTQYGGRTALSLHWILVDGADETELKKVIQHSGTLYELINGLRHQRAFFSPSAQHMIDEVETILWQKR